MNDFKHILIAFVGFILFGWIVYLQMQINALRSKANRQITYMIDKDTIDADSIKWDNLINAIIEVESEGKIDAVNDASGATGVMQLMPIAIKDCNRIIGKKKYGLNDRYSKDRSIEIFNIIQRHYNPQHDIHKAIKIQNPNGGKRYETKVINKLKK